MEVTQQESENQLTWTLAQALSVTATLGADLQNGRAGAGMSISTNLLNISVLEPVLFTGTHALGELIPSGTILQPGNYSFHSLWFGSIQTMARPGETTNASLDRTFSYEFTRVPVPAPIWMIASGLCVLLLSRRLGVRGRTSV
jgi:hypothetical protein